MSSSVVFNSPSSFPKNLQNLSTFNRFYGKRGRKETKSLEDMRKMSNFVAGKDKYEHYGREGFQTTVGQRVQVGAYRHAEPEEGVDGIGG